MIKTSLIVAVAENGVIGKNNDMPWHIKSEFQYFKRTTTGKPVIMGRKSFDALGGKPLPNRSNIIITRDPHYTAAGITVVHTLEDALKAARKIAQATKVDEIFIAGGAEIYRLALPLTDRFYLTHIHLKPEGDIFFPPYDPAEWVEIKREFHKAQKGESADYTITVLERK